jgi:hypothetical protein
VAGSTPVSTKLGVTGERHCEEALPSADEAIYRLEIASPADGGLAMTAGASSSVESSTPARKALRRWGGRLAKGTAAVLLVYLTFGIFVARVTYPGAASKASPLPLHRRGVMHVHTVRSDGRSTFEEIAGDAKRAGLDFVFVTDHNRAHPSPATYMDGVLMVDGTERSTRQGHRIEFGDIHIAAHPLNRRRPYTTLGKEALTGVEVLSGDDLWRDALIAPTHGFIQGLLAYPFNPQHALMQIVPWPDATMSRWMELAAEHPLVGDCAIDAHGYPPYFQEFRALQMHLLLETEPTGDAEADANNLLRALSEGRLWCALEPLVDGAGFSFEARDAAGGEHPLGSEVSLAAKPVLLAELRLEPLPPGSNLSLLKGMELVASSPTGRLEFTPTEPGPYRVEASFEGRTLFGGAKTMKGLFSNPIYVQGASGAD